MPRTEAGNEALDAYLSFLQRTAAAWPHLKGSRRLPTPHPGTQDAYDWTAHQVLVAARDEGIKDAASPPYASGTLTIMRYHYLLALKSREAGFSREEAVRLLHNHATYVTLGRIAIEPAAMAEGMKHILGLKPAQRLDDELFLRHWVLDTDRFGDPKVRIGNFSGMQRYLITRPWMIAELEQYTSPNPDERTGCPALHGGQLKPAYEALADIVTSDPDLLDATLRQ